MALGYLEIRETGVQRGAKLQKVNTRQSIANSKVQFFALEGQPETFHSTHL